MRISDILRKMADVVDQAEGGEQAVQAEPTQIAPASPEAIAQEPAQEPGIHATAISGEIEMPAEETPCCAADDDELTMVSPLQQEHELLKKSQGVNNNVSEFAGDESGEEGYQDELAAMKQSAGIGEEQANKAAHEEQRQMEDQLNPRRNAALAFHKGRSDRAS